MLECYFGFDVTTAERLLFNSKLVYVQLLFAFVRRLYLIECLNPHTMHL